MTKATELDFTNLPELINEHFHPLLMNKKRYLLLKGGAGSGKSWFTAQKFLVRILLDMEKGIKHRILAIRKTSPAARQSVFKLFENLVIDWGVRTLCAVNRTDMTFTFKNGSEILVRGFDNPEKVKSIEGLTSIWMEEATEFVQEDFDELDRRLRGDKGTYKQIVISFNPISKLSWIFQTFVKKENDKAEICHSTFKNNQFLANDEEYKEILEKYKTNRNNYQYKVYYLGEWGSLEGLVYKSWTKTDEMPVCDEYIYGCDFGFRDPTAVVRVGALGESFYVEELLYNKNRTNRDLIEWFRNSLPSDAAVVYCDSANPDRIRELQREGVRARPARKGVGSVQAGIDFIKGRDLHLKGRNLLNEVQDYTYKRDRQGNSMEKPKDGNDHLLDAMRYAIFTHFSNKRVMRIYI